MTAKQERFVAEYLIDLNATRAYKKVYGCSDEVARKSGSRLLTNVDIKAAIAKGQEQAIERIELTQDYVITNLVEVLERCMERAPVMVRDGNEWKQLQNEAGADVWRFDARGSVASLTLLGKQLGMFKDQVEHSGEIGLSASEREQQIVGILTAARKRQKELVS